MICLLLNALDDRGFRGSGVVEHQKDTKVQQEKEAGFLQGCMGIAVNAS